MNVVGAVALALAFLGIILFPIMLYRNSRVANFRQHIIDLCYGWNVANIEGDENAYEWFLEAIPSYDKMLYSFKRLTLSNWASDELINKLLNKSNDNRQN